MLLSDATFQVIDVETTGLDPSRDRVVECAVVAIVSKNGQPCIRDEWGCSRLFNPGIPIPPEASAVHHITDEDVAGMSSFADVPSSSFSCSVSVAHNAEFDSQFVPQVVGTPWLCTLRMAKKLWPTLERYGNQYLRYYHKLPVPRNIGPSHRAFADAVVTAHLLIHELSELAVQRPEIETVEQLLEWLAEPILLHRIGFGKYGPKDGQPGMLWSDVPRDYLSWMQRNMTDMDADMRHTVKHYLG